MQPETKTQTVWCSAFERGLGPRNLLSGGGSEGGRSPPPSILTPPCTSGQCSHRLESQPLTCVPLSLLETPDTQLRETPVALRTSVIAGPPFVDAFSDSVL
jgi:hypothetical protein